MTHIAYSGKNHLLIVHSPGEGPTNGKERCPDRATFEEFLKVRAALRKSGQPVPSIQSLFPTAYEAHGGALLEGRKQTIQGGRPQTGALGHLDEYKFDGWIGTAEAPGPFFTHRPALDRQDMGISRRRSYFALLRDHAKHLVGRPLSTIDWEDAARVTNNMLTCAACLKRAESAGRIDLIARRDLHLRGTQPPWDGACEDADGISTHFVELKENTLKDKLGALRTAFAVAQFCGKGQRPRDPRCRPNLENPFETFVYPKYEPRPRPYDYARALTHGEVRRVAELMPEQYRAAVIVCTYGMFRRSELLGLSRSNLIMPTEPDQMGQAEINLTHVWIGGQLRGWGKTSGSVGTRFFLPAFATDALRVHLQEFRSTPNPTACDACRAGQGEHLDPRRKNPHRRCDFADNASVWIDPATGSRPDSDHFSQVFAEAIRAAGLDEEIFVPTVRTLRATGATLRIEAGEHIESVRKQGRWANLDVLLKHYFKPTAEAQRLANARLDIGIRATWGLATTETDSLSEELNRLRAIIAAQEVEIERYRASGIALNGPTRIDRDKRRRGMYNGKDIRAACEGATTVYEVARNLGLSGGRHSLARIRRIAAEEGIELPGGYRGGERDAS